MVKKTKLDQYSIVIKDYIREGKTNIFLTAWENGEGFDTTFELDSGPKQISMTYTEFDAMTILVNNSKISDIIEED